MNFGVKILEDFATWQLFQMLAGKEMQDKTPTDAEQRGDRRQAARRRGAALAPSACVIK